MPNSRGMKRETARAQVDPVISWHLEQRSSVRRLSVTPAAYEAFLKAALDPHNQAVQDLGEGKGVGYRGFVLYPQGRIKPVTDDAPREVAS